MRPFSQRRRKMKRVDMIVKAPHFYTMQGEGVGYKSGVAMIVNGGKIEEFVPLEQIGDYKADEILDMDHHVILPGLIDGHMHSCYNIFRGLAQDANGWMMYGIQPFNNIETRESVDAGAKVALLESIKAGTTTLGDYNTYMDDVCQFIEKVGARGNLTCMVRDALKKTYQPGELYEFNDALGTEEFQRNLDLFDRWHNKANGRIKILFGPQAADFVSAELLLKIQKAAKERKTKIHLHVQQGDRETDQIMRRYGKRPTKFLEDLGYLDQDLIAVHLTDCTDEEAMTIARHGASMAVNPGCIGLVDGLVCPSLAFQKAGGNVALGSDQAAGNNCHNMFNEMKNISMMYKIRYQDPEIMPAWRALRLATIEGARAIGLGDITGSLEPGKQADFIAVDLNIPSMQPVFTYPMRNIVPNLVYSARGHEVRLSVVDGKIILKDGKVLAVDEDDLMAEMQKYPDELGKAASKEFFEINGPNVRFMEEDKL